MTDPLSKGLAVTGTSERLRQSAEARVEPRPAPAVPEEVGGQEADRLAHELRVHQVELEMQNEELRRALNQLELARSRYFDLYELAPVGYLTLDEDWRIQEANLRVTALLGTDRATLLQAPLSRFVHSQDQDAYHFFRQSQGRPGSPRSCELRLLPGQGGELWVRLEGGPARDGNGDGFPGRLTLTDITELKAAVEALRESEEKYRTIADFTYDWEYWLDPDQKFRYCSAACLRLTGYTAAEFLANPGLFLDIVHPADRLRVEGHLKDPAASPGRLEFRIIHRSEEVRWLGHACCCVRGRDGAYLGRRGCNRDITEAKKAEAETRRLQEELHQAQRMESVGRLAGGVAHDFNNMLAVIVGYAEMVLESLGPAHPEYDGVKEILGAAQRSGDLTRQLLAFARKQPISPRILELNEAVSRMLKLLRRLIGEDIELVFAAGPGPLPIFLDPSQLDQILANLCVNARDAMPHGGQICLETGEAMLPQSRGSGGCQERRHVSLAVRDNGCGMDPDLLQHIFEPFFTTKGAGQGTGMGLATVYGVVHQNGGCLQVDSSPGRGSTFRIYLPRAEDTETAEQIPPTELLPPGRGEVILLVEDQPEVLAMAAKVLKRLGYKVLTAPGPRQALDLARTLPIPVDLLISDIVMPDLTGGDLADKMTEKFPGLRTLLISGYAGEALGGGRAVLAKPFTPRQLGKKVRETLDT